MYYEIKSNIVLSYVYYVVILCLFCDVEYGVTYILAFPVILGSLDGVFLSVFGFAFCGICVLYGIMDRIASPGFYFGVYLISVLSTFPFLLCDE